MKILYAIQSTGNGHLSRAKEIIPHLAKEARVDLLVSGPDYSIDFPFQIKYRHKGFGFIFGKNGGIDFLESYLKSKILELLKDIRNLPVEKYDIVISDFEPVSAWACQLKKIPCIGLSNQVALLSPNAPKPKKIDLSGRLILQHYAPSTSHIGIHYAQFDKHVFTPIIREEIRKAKTRDDGHYTVYLPAYEDAKIKKHLLNFKKNEWEVFSKETKKVYSEKNITFRPVNTEAFTKSMITSSGVLTAAGFGTTTEALFLKKKLLVIPQKAQFEQQYNAAVLKSMGVSVVKKLKKKHYDKISEWLNDSSFVRVNYPDNAQEIVQTILRTGTSKEFKKIIPEIRAIA